MLHPPAERRRDNADVDADVDAAVAHMAATRRSYHLTSFCPGGDCVMTTTMTMTTMTTRCHHHVGGGQGVHDISMHVFFFFLIRQT
jgi:hypothetical protein